MKYTANNKPLVCMMTQSTCYKGTSKMVPVGVLWHSTGAKNPNLSRYVQPDDNAANRDDLIAIIGKNLYKNDFNHIVRKAGLNCWIGKFADGSVGTVQTMPWDFKPWGCGNGSKGSCNNGWIQFEICEDSLTNRDYFEAVYKEACEITAYLCKMYNLDPNGTVMYNGVSVPVILDHTTSCSLKLGSNHGDVQHWFKKYGKTMNDVRNDVAKLLSATETQKPTISVDSKPVGATGTVTKGDIVKIASNSTYYNGKSVPTWVKNLNWVVNEVTGDRAVLGKSEDGKYNIASPVNIKYLSIVKDAEAAQEFKPFVVKITANTLNYRQGPGTNYKVNGTLSKGGAYTIVEAQGDWGKLKSGAGWIHLSYTKKI